MQVWPGSEALRRQGSSHCWRCSCHTELYSWITADLALKPKALSHLQCCICNAALPMHALLRFANISVAQMLVQGKANNPAMTHHMDNCRSGKETGICTNIHS